MICPNCIKPLEYAGKTKYDNYVYDKYTCEGCPHIIVLDWRDDDE